MTPHARILLVAAGLCLLGGCFDVTDEITWSADGSARLRRTIRIAMTPETAGPRADAINKEAEYASIQINNKVGGVKSFELLATADGPNVVVSEDLTVADATSLSAVQVEAAKYIKVDGTTFEWTPTYAFDRLANGRVQFRASLNGVKVPASFDRSTAKTTFGDKQFVLKLHAPSIASAAPSGTANGANYVEWKTSIADIAGGEMKDPELAAEIVTTASSGLALVGGVVAALLIVVVIAVMLRKPASANPTMRPPAPRVMPTVLDSGPVERVASDEALLSDASEINVDADEDIPTGAAAAAQAAAGGVVKFKCPKCQVELKVPLHLAGQKGKCRKCGGAFVSPVPAQLKKVRAAVEPTDESGSLRDAFSVKKVKCSCGVTSAVLKGRAAEGEERCPACNQVLVLT
ncbi:MAG TPA: hypothetical protein VFF73_24215 [Planctomycetota bacterium]|nr:hypothetical protein [Planctomycetota bacterium]